MSTAGFCDVSKYSAPVTSAPPELLVVGGVEYEPKNNSLKPAMAACTVDADEEADAALAAALVADAAAFVSDVAALVALVAACKA
jgi:hypothetical protein